MKIKIGTVDITDFVGKVSWSGDYRQVARKLSFDIVQSVSDKSIGKVSVKLGDKVSFYKADKLLFTGVLFTIDKSTSASAQTLSCLAFDLAWYVNQSDITKVYNSTPEGVASKVCMELGIPFGGAAKTGIKVKVAVFGKKAYEAIMMAYTKASRQNGKKYMPIMNGGKFTVIEKGKSSGVTLDGNINLLDTKYSTSIEGMVTKVLIVNRNDKVIGRVINAKNAHKYGTVQKVYKKEDGKNAKSRVKTMLKGVSKKASINALSDTRAIAGYSIIIKDKETGISGVYYIASDNHSFDGAVSKMSLELEFKNFMDTKEEEAPKRTKRKGRAKKEETKS